MAPSPCTELVGVLSPPFMAEPPRLPLFRPATPSFSLPRSNPCRPILIQRLSVADTPSRIDLLKSPPGFTYLNPSSLA